MTLPHPPASPTDSSAEPRGAGRAAQALVERLHALDDPAGLEEESGPGGRRRWRGWLLALLAILLPAVAGAAVWSTRSVLADPYQELGLRYEPVERGTIVFTVVEKGELEAVRNTDVICRVRNKPGNWFATSLKWIIEDGTQVRKGDVVARLEDSSLREQYQTQTIAVTEKQALLVEAEREKEIVASQNQIAIKVAQNNLEIARINQEKFLKGELPQKQKDVNGRITLARAELRGREDRLAWSSRMLRKGFSSVTQNEAEENLLEGARINLNKLLEEKRVLEEYEAKVEQLDLASQVEQAEVALKVAQTEAEGKAAKAYANLRAKATILDQEEAKLRELAADIANCTITAPNDGMVVYFSREGSKVGAGSQKNILAVGEPVYENQKLMLIPDLRRMRARVKIHESVQPRLRGDTVRKTNLWRGLYAGLAVSPPGYAALETLLAGPVIRRAAAEEGLLPEDEVVRPGQPAQVRLAALDRILSGRVQWISTVASQLDALSSDVRVYPTLVSIDDTYPDLRPGMSVEVTIAADERDRVLQLPVHALLEVGGEKFCYVKKGREVEKRVVETGLNNSRFVEVRRGLEEGELVVQNPRPLAEQRGDLNARVRPTKKQKDLTQRRPPLPPPGTGGGRGGKSKEEDQKNRQAAFFSNGSPGLLGVLASWREVLLWTRRGVPCAPLCALWTW